MIHLVYFDSLGSHARTVPNFGLRTQLDYLENAAFVVGCYSTYVLHSFASS